jgi:hypothetical protein
MPKQAGEPLLGDDTTPQAAWKKDSNPANRPCQTPVKQGPPTQMQ